MWVSVIAAGVILLTMGALFFKDAQVILITLLAGASLLLFVQMLLETPKILFGILILTSIVVLAFRKITL